MKNKVKYQVHNKVCELCINFDLDKDSKPNCYYLEREAHSFTFRMVHKHNEITIAYNNTNFCDMVLSVANNMGVTLQDLTPESLISLNKDMQCPFFAHRFDIGRIFFKDNSAEWKSKYDACRCIDPKPEILRNAIMTPDGTMLESRFRHDYVSYKDKVSKETYFTDGGFSYIKRSINKIPYKDFTVYSSDPIERIRLHFKWGTRGKDGTQKLTWVHLYKMSDAHIVAAMQSLVDDSVVRELFEREKVYRKLHNIKIEE